MVETHAVATPGGPPESAVRARAILVIEDEPRIRRAIRDALHDVADRVLEASGGREGVALATAERPELVVLDLGLPDVAGLDVCSELRRTANMPIIVLSARHAEQEKVLLLNAGADDYITKPFSPRELEARVRAQLRRAVSGALADSVVTTGELTIDLAGRTVRRAGRVIHLTPIEWDILRTLVTQANRTLTHQQIFDAVWRRQFGNPQQYLRVYITTLRRKIEVDPTRPQLIITEPGVGYRIELAR
jgi:two-component system, OmpR family, KDP operon response regulator KdpE